MANNIQETQRKRFQFLQKLYEVTEGSELASVNLWELGTELGFSRPETDRIDEYLTGEGLTTHIALGGSLGITHQGIVEVEAALSKPDEPSSYFPPVNNYFYVDQMIGSQIQQGTSQSSQVLTYNANDIEALLKFVADMKSQLSELKLDADSQAEVQADVETIETQIKSPRPKFAAIKECLVSLRTILEGIAENVIASLLAQQIGTLLK
jgi:hypothetical protein